jgi:hypothetical protein
LRQKFRHVFHGVRRIGVDRERAAVDHDLAVQPRRVRRTLGDDALPILICADEQEQPIEPRHVIGEQQHRSRRLQHFLVVGAEAQQQPKQKAQQCFHFSTKDERD